MYNLSDFIFSKIYILINYQKIFIDMPPKKKNDVKAAKKADLKASKSKSP